VWLQRVQLLRGGRRYFSGGGGGGWSADAGAGYAPLPERAKVEWVTVIRVT